MNLREYAAQQQQNKPPGTAQNSPQRAEERAGQVKPHPTTADPYKGIYRAVFDFHQRHSPYPATPDDWAAAAEDLGQTIAATGNNPFATSLLLAVYEEMERQWKGAQGLDTG